MAAAVAWLERENRKAELRRWTRIYPEAKRVLAEVAEGLTAVAGEKNLRSENPAQSFVRVIPRSKFIFYMKVVEEVEDAVVVVEDNN